MNLDSIKKLPNVPGIYMMLDRDRSVIYVGKAKSLRKRVSSYFRKTSGHSSRIGRMISHIEDIDFIVTENEVEALILESNLIKKHFPPYNVVLRDDKHYPYIKITRGDPFPRIMVVRRVKRDRHLYLGPYPSSSSLREVLKFIYRT
ncbi:MAG: GIY-YIG nuclease family protein, partial [Nitrospinae bacterium]|nr:GIY-YIG nuclease family protein [Nitrospinota bacterium]